MMQPTTPHPTRYNVNPLGSAKADAARIAQERGIVFQVVPVPNTTAFQTFVYNADGDLIDQSVPTTEMNAYAFLQSMRWPWRPCDTDPGMADCKRRSPLLIRQSPHWGLS